MKEKLRERGLKANDDFLGLERGGGAWERPNGPPQAVLAAEHVVEPQARLYEKLALCFLCFLCGIFERIKKDMKY